LAAIALNPHANETTEATREEMSAARLPLAYRDSCANLLIPLNKCRQEEFYLPWKCEVRSDAKRSGCSLVEGEDEMDVSGWR
jgi:hypothetical protein